MGESIYAASQTNRRVGKRLKMTETRRCVRSRIYRPTYMHACMHACMHAMYTPICVYGYTYAFTWMHANTFARTDVYRPIRTFVVIYKCIKFNLLGLRVGVYNIYSNTY